MGNGQMVIWAISSWTNERNQYLVKNVIKDAVFPLFKEEFILKRNRTSVQSILISCRMGNIILEQTNI